MERTVEFDFPIFSVLLFSSNLWFGANLSVLNSKDKCKQGAFHFFHNYSFLATFGNLLY